MSGNKDMSRAKAICENCNQPWESHTFTNHYCPGPEMRGYGPTRFKQSRLPPEPKGEAALVCHLRNGLILCPHGRMAFRGCTDCGPNVPCIPMAEVNGSSLEPAPEAAGPLEFKNSCTKCFQYTNDPVPRCEFCEEDTLVPLHCPLCGWPKSIGCHHPDSQLIAAGMKPSPATEGEFDEMDAELASDIKDALVILKHERATDVTGRHYSELFTRFQNWKAARAR